MKYFCVCSKCSKVYHYKDTTGKHFGTRNLLQHTWRCVGICNEQVFCLCDVGNSDDIMLHPC